MLDRAADAGVSHIFMPAIDFDSIPQMEAIKHERVKLYMMAGIHPSEVRERSPGLEERLLEYCSREDIIAVGETGLDYYWTTDYVEEQKESLHVHCRVARETGKPIVLHNRDSTSDVLDIIEAHQDGSLTGEWHCFTGTVDEGRRAVDLGLHLGIGGILTFKNAGVDKAVAQLPLDKMMLETDAPYLAPDPKRGKRNEPSFIQYTARKLAEVMNVPLEEVVESTTKTALQLFRPPS